MNPASAALRTMYVGAVRSCHPTSCFPSTWHQIAQVSTLMNAHNQTNAVIDDLLNMVTILAKRIEVLEDEAAKRS